MIEIAKNIIDLILQFFNSIFNFKIELVEGEPISIGLVVVPFIFFVIALYLILKGLGVIGKDDD